MTKRMTAIATAAATIAMGLAAIPAQARPHHRLVCHMEHHHGHRVRVCHHM